MRIRLRQFRDRLRLTLEEMAEKSGYSVSQLSRWENGASNIPSERLPALALAYECRIADIFDEDSPFLQLGPTLPIIGEVAAGVWHEVWQWEEQRWESFTGRSDVNAPLTHRFGLRVVGDSMNDVYPHGTVVECVTLLGGAELQPGKRVVVQRKREDGEFEVTVKEYVLDEDENEWLVPRSNRPEFQTAMRMDEKQPGIEEITIIAVVVASVRPE